MLAMVGTMYLLRKVDQEEPIVLLYARLAFLAYVVVVTSLYSLLHWRITSRCDLSPVTVPAKPKSPSFKEAMEQMKKAAEEQQSESSGEKADSESTDKQDGANEKDEQNKKEVNKTETITTMEYDLRTLANARRSWVMNCLILAAVNYKTESVSAIIISPLMTLIRFVTEDPLFLIHVAGSPAVDKLKRPFTPPESPFSTLLKEMSSKEPPKDQKTEKKPEEDLHDDGESEEEDNGPTRLTELKDDHIKSDFDEDDEPKKTK